MTGACIFDAVRTPRGRGKADGALHAIAPVRLLAGLCEALAERNVLDSAAVDDVIIGCVTATGEQGGDIARAAVLAAGWDERVPGVTLSRFCASGLEAIDQAAARVAGAGEGLVVAGGVESMSRCPMGDDGGAWMLDPRVNDAAGFVPQGVSADLLATLDGVDRETLDRFGARSHQLAAAARAAGYFDRSLVPVRDVNGLIVLDRDETIRPETDTAALAALEPSFAGAGARGFDAQCLARYPWLEAVEHLHHPGTSSAIVDGAALAVVGSEARGRELGLTPRARIRASAVVGTEPTVMLTGPAPATRKALARAGMAVGDVDLFEINEAFAAVVLRAQRELDIDPERVNVNGGAIAMGHPLGATGAVLVSTLLDELERRDAGVGVVTLCAGGGMGIATVIERCR